MTENYKKALQYLHDVSIKEVGGCWFYQGIFPNNENAGELYTDFSHPNAIYLYQDEQDEGTKRRLRRRIMLKDTWEEDYKKYIKNNSMTLCSGLSYRRRANKLENAQRMHALIIDLDGVGYRELEVLFYRFDKPAEGQVRTLPKPTCLALSGNGVHLYYVFEKPVDLYPNIKLQLKQLKHNLTFRIWEYKATSQYEQIQYQSINQGFRMVGSINKNYGTEVKGFHIGERITLDYLNKYVREENRVDVNRPFRPSKMTRAEAAENYPEWYQRVVLEGNKKLKKWNIKNGDALYNWWLNTQISKAKGGHRYFFLMCLAIYACKCNIPKKRLKKDMQAAFEILKNTPHGGDELTQADVDSALEAYDKELYNFTIDDIMYLTDIHIEKNKRNGRKQEQHMKIMSAVRDVIHADGSWRNKDGRPSAAAAVKKYREENPEARKIDCHRDTGLSRPTIQKWWNTPLQIQQDIVNQELKSEAEVIESNLQQLTQAGI